MPINLYSGGHSFHPENIEIFSSNPDGTPRKLLSIEKLKKLGWSPRISMEQGLVDTYQWFKDYQESFRG